MELSKSDKRFYTALAFTAILLLLMFHELIGNTIQYSLEQFQMTRQSRLEQRQIEAEAEKAAEQERLAAIEAAKPVLPEIEIHESVPFIDTSDVDCVLEECWSPGNQKGRMAFILVVHDPNIQEAHLVKSLIDGKLVLWTNAETEFEENMQADVLANVGAKAWEFGQEELNYLTYQESKEVMMTLHGTTFRWMQIKNAFKAFGAGLILVPAGIVLVTIFLIVMARNSYYKVNPPGEIEEDEVVFGKPKTRRELLDTISQELRTERERT